MSLPIATAFSAVSAGTAAAPQSNLSARPAVGAAPLFVAGWEWHLDPAFASDMTPEICAGLTTAIARSARQTNTATASLSASPLQVVKHSPARTVCRWNTDNLDVYLKCYHSPDWSSRLRSWWRGGLARFEATQLQQLAHDGLAVPRVVCRANCCTGEYDSLLLTVAIANSASLGDWLRPGRLGASDRRNLLDATGRLLARIHAVGWHHHDLHAGNVLASRGAADQVQRKAAWSMNVIDVAAMRRDTTVVAAVQQFAQLRHSLHRVLSRSETGRLLRQSVFAGAAKIVPASDIRQALTAARDFSLQQWARQDRKWARGNSKQQTVRVEANAGSACQARCLATIAAPEIRSLLAIPATALPLQLSLSGREERLHAHIFLQASTEIARESYLRGLALWRRKIPVLQPLACTELNSVPWLISHVPADALSLATWLGRGFDSPMTGVATSSRQLDMLQQAIVGWESFAARCGVTWNPADNAESAAEDMNAWFVRPTSTGIELLAGPAASLIVQFATTVRQSSALAACLGRQAAAQLAIADCNGVSVPLNQSAETTSAEGGTR